MGMSPIGTISWLAEALNRGQGSRWTEFYFYLVLMDTLGLHVSEPALLEGENGAGLLLQCKVPRSGREERFDSKGGGENAARRIASGYAPNPRGRSQLQPFS